MKNFKPAPGTRMPLINDPVYHQIINEIRDYAIFMLDTEGHIMTWNEGCIRIKGYTAEEIVGKHFSILFPEDERKKQAPEREIEGARQHGHYEEEEWRLRKDGTLFWALISLTAVHDEEGNVVGFTKVTRDLTERKLAEDALYYQNEKLLRINADLDDFVYTASHDLKSPVVNIEGLLNAIDDHTPPERLKKILSFLKISVGKLKETINGLSDVAIVNKDLEEGNEETVRLRDVLEDVQYALSHKMREDCPHISLHLQVEEIKFSRLNLKSILYNLLSNAIKYKSPHHPCQVELSAYQEDNYTILRVTDNGIGIPENFQKKIFNMFSRMNTHIEGTGIGLYILKRIVDNVNGRIELDSKEGEGSSFTIYLPCKEQKKLNYEKNHIPASDSDM